MTRILVAVALLLGCARNARGHAFEPAVLELREGAPGVFDVALRVAAAHADAHLTPVLPASCRWTGAPPAAEAERVTLARAECGPGRLGGARLGMHGLAGTRFDAIVRITWADGRTASGVLTGEAEEMTVPTTMASDAPAAVVLWSYTRLGIQHMLSGVDHLLFVLGLLLLVPDWRRLVATVTAFTLAHSVSLALAVLGLATVPPPPVEASIALSIVFLASELARPGDTLGRRFPWLLAFAFGLLHGLGFAGALSEIGLPANHLPLALFAFNVGVEIGQLAFVLLMIAPVAAFRRFTARRTVWRLVPAYAIGMVACAWTIERVLRFWSPAG